MCCKIRLHPIQHLRRYIKNGQLMNIWSLTASNALRLKLWLSHLLCPFLVWYSPRYRNLLFNSSLKTNLLLVNKLRLFFLDLLAAYCDMLDAGVCTIQEIFQNTKLQLLWLMMVARITTFCMLPYKYSATLSHWSCANFATDSLFICLFFLLNY